MSDQYPICDSCAAPAQHLSDEQLCPSCQWMADKDALCETCDHPDMMECTGIDVECLAGGYHCKHYHVNCDMMQPYQYEMFGETIMSDDNKANWFTISKDDSIEPLPLDIEWTFCEPEPCSDCETSRVGFIKSYEMSFTFELSPQMKLQFYRVIFPGLVEAFGDSIN